MPLAKSLSKVTKKIAKQPGALHAKGRKFKQINRATERDRRLKSQKLKHDEQKNHLLLFYLHFQETINEEYQSQETFSIAEIVEILNKWVTRDDEELAQIDKERRPGRSLTSKQQLLKEKRKHEDQLFDTGMRVPDLTNKDTVYHLRNWNGTSGSVSGWKFTIVLRHLKDEDAME